MVLGGFRSFLLLVLTAAAEQGVFFKPEVLCSKKVIGSIICLSLLIIIKATLSDNQDACCWCSVKIGCN